MPSCRRRGADALALASFFRFEHHAHGRVAVAGREPMIGRHPGVEKGLDDVQLDVVQRREVGLLRELVLVLAQKLESLVAPAGSTAAVVGTLREP